LLGKAEASTICQASIMCHEENKKWDWGLGSLMITGFPYAPDVEE